MSTALLTDRYELTMLQAALRSGAAARRCVFEVFTRRLPAGRRYGVVAGVGRVLEELDRFRFGDAELTWLRDARVVDDVTIDWLANYRFSGSIDGYADGECFFPGSPVMTVEGSFAEAVLLETLVLSILNHDSAIAGAASRMTNAAGNRPCLEMGSRRTHEEAAVAAARAAVIAGFVGTSNLEAGRRYGLRTIGTAAHAFTLVHDDERQAFAAQVVSLGADTTLLVDTYDVTSGVRAAIEAAGTSLGSVRLDSGDLLGQAYEVRAQLDALGATSTKIVVTSDLDEFAIATLAQAPVDSYGVGTSLVTGSGAPTAGFVYKLVARETSDGSWESVEKRSASKASVGGRKRAVRLLDDDGQAVEEVVTTYGSPTAAQADATADDPYARQLMIPLVRNGDVAPGLTGRPGVERARDRHRASVAELPRQARRLQRGDAAILTSMRTR